MSIFLAKGKIVHMESRVKGRFARINGYAKVCGNAKVDGTVNEVVIKGYFSTTSGSYSSGVYNSAQSKQSVRKKSTKELVGDFINALDDYSYTYYTFTKNDVRKMSHDVSYNASVDNASNPCEVVITQIKDRDALRSGKYAVTPYIKTTLRVSMETLKIYSINQSDTKRQYDGSNSFRFSIDRRKTGDLYVYEYKKTENYDDEWVYKKGYKTVNGMWFYNDSKERLQNLFGRFNAAINSCANG